jgi:hypothetical protein
VNAKHRIATVTAVLSISGLALAWAGQPDPDRGGQRTPPAATDGTQTDAPMFTVKLGKVPDLHLAPRSPVGEAQAKRIKSLIASLAMLDSPDFGLSTTLSGDAFSPVAGQTHTSLLLLTDHQVKPSEAVKALVSLGPDALPFLLDALNDKTPTKITVRHEGFVGAMWYGDELRLSPVNPAEETTFKARAAGREDQRGKDERLKSYTVKVGDVCFVAVGQIVGRGYEAVRYKPTACIVINSPTHDAKLCADVRALWTSKDPARKLFDALLADYATEGIFNGESLDGWDIGSNLQCRAALRLLYYFPKETAPLIAARLDNLDVTRGKGANGYMRRDVANGVRAKDFIDAVAWCQEPAIKSSLAALFKRAEDVAFVLAALPAISDAELIRGRLEPLVNNLPPEEDGPDGDGYRLLVALGERTPSTAKPVFQRYLRDASPQRCHTVCLALAEAKPPWDSELLGPLLADKRPMDWTYEPGKGRSRLPLRVCDAAASTLSKNHPELKFTLAGGHADLDKQIAVIQERLGRGK